MDDSLHIPSYYVVSRHLPKEHASPILAALSITPIDCAIISDTHDAVLALELSPRVLRVSSEADALKLAHDLAADGQCVPLVVGEAPVLDAYFLDGHRESVACTC